MGKDFKVKRYSELCESTPYPAFGGLVTLDELFRIDTTNRYTFKASLFSLPNGGDMVLYGGKLEGHEVYLPFVGLLPGHFILTSPMVKVVTSHDFGGTLGVVTTTASPIFWYANGERVSGQ